MSSEDLRIAFLTYCDRPGLTPDDALAAAFLRSAAIVDAVPWDAPDSVECLATYDLVIIRSTWNYTEVYDRFFQWLDQAQHAGVPLCNSADTVRWNADKIYLRELAEAEYPVMETQWLDCGSQVDLKRALTELGVENAIVKPRISATARGLFKTSVLQAERDQPKLDALLETHDVMLQPFAEEIVDRGEWSLVFFGGRFSHAVLKHPKSGDHRVQSNFGGNHTLEQPSPALVKDGQRLVDACAEREGSPLLYARVDGIERFDQLILMELELIEPELFFRADPDAPARLMRAIQALH